MTFLEQSVSALNSFANTLQNLLGGTYVYIQYLFGLGGIILAIIAYLCKNRVKLLILQVFCNLCWTMYFTMLGQFLGMAMNVFSLIRNLIFSQKDKHAWANSKAWLFGFIVIMTTFSLLTYQNWYDFMSIIGTLCMTVGYFCSNRKTLLILSFIGCPLWVAYGIFAGSYMGIISDTLNGVSIVYALCVLNKERKSSREI